MDIKEEPLVDHHHERRKSILMQTESESSKMNICNQMSDLDHSSMKHTNQQRKNQSMIVQRKDYSYKYVNNKPKTPLTPVITSQQEKNLDILQKTSQPIHEDQSINKNITKPSNLQSLLLAHKGKNTKRSVRPISILERHDYDKSSKIVKIEKFDDDDDYNENTVEDDEYRMQEESSAIDESMKSPLPVENLKNSNVPMNMKCIDATTSESSSNKKIDCSERERDKLKVIVAQEVESPVIKQEPGESTLRPQTLSTESKDSQNINKINNKINIIFQLNDNTKSLRKNIILHRRAPKKTVVQKITIKETNNNNSTKTQSDETTVVPEKILCTIETQTEEHKTFDMNMSVTSPLTNETTEYLFFENDVLISLQSNIISFFEYNRLSSLLKKGESDFRLIDRIPRLLQDIQVDSDNKFQRLCYNDLNSLPIYVEMRAKQKELDDPQQMCPIAFLYCNVYYIDQKRAKLSSVHLDTVKSVIHDITYTTVPTSSYFIMAWNEKCLDTKGIVTGIVKYKLTPNLDLAKLASIRQFPKLNYRIKQMYCGRGNINIFINHMNYNYHVIFLFLDSQLITIGDTQISIFNYDNGDLLISLDLMRSYGMNLTTFEYKEV